MSDSRAVNLPSLLLDLIRILAVELNAIQEINDDCKELLESLEPAHTSRRFDQVEQAHRQTFEWLFAKPGLGFESWLRSGQGLYWCRGYPGSGKSTLMKWVYNDPRTIRALTVGEVRKIKASFFFHDRGSEIQKSFKGLLQGIVHQILKGIPELLALIVPTRLQLLKRLDAQWTEEDIQKAFNVLLRQQNMRLDITLFLDALDEYNGNHESITSFLYSITDISDTAMTNIKVCFSSRPLQIFLDKFAGAPGFDIHEHTIEDIRVVVKARLSQNTRMSQCMEEATPRYRQLISKFAYEIISRAEGIFLWVNLVLDELLDEFTAGESLRELIKKLVLLPRELEDFYQRTLHRLPRQYIDEARVIFEVLCCAMEPLRLHDFFEICRYSKIASLVDCAPCTDMDNEWSVDSMQRWTRSRTGGLVQLIPYTEEEFDPKGGSHYRGYMCPSPYRRRQSIYTVQFLHQTVKSFSQSARWATSPAVSRFPHHNGYAYIARYILALLFHHSQCDSFVDKRWSFSDDEDDSLTEQVFWGRYGAFYLIEPLCTYIYLAENQTPKIFLSPLTEFGDNRMNDLFQIKMWTLEMRKLPLSCVSALAVVCDLCDLLDELLELEKGRLCVSSPPLLHLAVSEPMLWMSSINSRKRSRSIQTLLDHGADTNEVFDGDIPYERLCKFIMTRKIHLDDNPHGGLAKLVIPFLQKGQDPNIKINFERRKGKLPYRLFWRCLLHHAAQSADCELLYILLEHGANVNAMDDTGSTALDCLCDGNRDYGPNSQLSTMVDALLQESPKFPPKQQLRRRIQAVSLLISRGGRFGIPTPDADDKFLDVRRSVNNNHLEILRSHGIDVDSRIVWSPQNQIKTGVSGFILEYFNLLKERVAR